jgi:hypothetical protein
VVAIHSHAGRAYAERVGGTAIVIRIERDEEVLGLAAENVAAAERRLDHRGIARIHARSDVKRVAVVGEPHFHPLGGGLSLFRFFLGEIRDDRRAPPRRVVQSPVEANGVVGHTNGDGALL